MKKRKKTNQPAQIAMQNPVAKFAGLFNKAHTFQDKTKYTRRNKHNKQEAWPNIFIGMISQAPCVLI